jgi:hypothetical protein
MSAALAGGMQTHQVKLRLLTLLSVTTLLTSQAFAADKDDIAANALAAEKNAKVTATEVRTTPPQRVSDKPTSVKPTDSRVTTVKRIDTQPKAIRNPSGTLIHPVVQDSDVPINPVPRKDATQEDYHSQQ